jgi:predicted ABC-type exoprotein transport system permease subunit
MIDFLRVLVFLLFLFCVVPFFSFVDFVAYPLSFLCCFLLLLLPALFSVFGWSYETMICMMGTCGGTENPNVYLITGFSLYIQQ